MIIGEVLHVDLKYGSLRNSKKKLEPNHFVIKIFKSFF